MFETVLPLECRREFQAATSGCWELKRNGQTTQTEELLEEIGVERTLLDETLDLIPRSIMTKPGVTRGGWSVKDVLAHLVEWQNLCLGWYSAGIRGEPVSIE